MKMEKPAIKPAENTTLENLQDAIEIWKGRKKMGLFDWFKKKKEEPQEEAVAEQPAEATQEQAEKPLVPCEYCGHIIEKNVRTFDNKHYHKTCFRRLKKQAASMIGA